MVSDSVLSAEAECCAWLCASPRGAGILLRTLAACAPRPPLAVRLAYTLGNMAAEHHHARLSIYNEPGGIDVLLTILESYTKRNDNDARDADSDPDLHSVGSDLGDSDGSNEDVLIKTVRVVANLCLAEGAGRGLASAHAARVAAALLGCLRLAEAPPHTELTDEQQSSWSERRSELATAALATLNNITFYRDPSDIPDPLEDTIDKICKGVL
ncbi:hypothetical protein O3G_MSEX015281 [Manduca sexta]|uniref:Uncharacterized protein n=1 Tax=Manduca sexta TaxID=7130 RepID=A0A922D542_MANSE|nr:hypothetical protein O3G_MSEX015281 [Manduca sexta]